MTGTAMDQLKMDVPLSFINARTGLTWREIAYGIDNGLLRPAAAIDFATACVGSDEDPSSDIVELAGLRPDEPTRELVDKIAGMQSEQDSAYIRGKWLYLVLAWLFENREAFAEPLAIVEEVYADFDYPEDVASFVRYMPMRGPDLGSAAANRKRLFDNWKLYLDKAALTFGRSGDSTHDEPRK